MDLGGKNLGPESAAIIAACIQRNRVLESLKCAAAPPCRVFAFPSAPIDTSQHLLAVWHAIISDRLSDPKEQLPLLKGSRATQRCKCSGKPTGARTGPKCSPSCQRFCQRPLTPILLASPIPCLDIHRKLLPGPLTYPFHVTQRWLQSCYGRCRGNSGQGGAGARRSDRLLRDPARLLAREQHHGAQPEG